MLVILLCVSCLKIGFAVKPTVTTSEIQFEDLNIISLTLAVLETHLRKGIANTIQTLI